MAHDSGWSVTVGASPVYPEFFLVFIAAKKVPFLMNSHIRLLLTKQRELSGEVL
jgi:hypothetical protein